MVRFPNFYELVLAVIAIIFCLLEIFRKRGGTRGLIVQGIALLLISLKLFALELMLYGLVLVAPAWVLMAYYWGPRRPEVGLAALALFVLLLIVIAFADRPNVLIGSLVAAPISLALSASHRYRPSAGMLLKAILIALPNSGNILWSGLALARLFAADPGGGRDPGDRASGPDCARPGGARFGVPGRVA